MPHRTGKTGEIMHRAEKNRADNYPQNDGQPAEIKSRKNRPHNRPRGRDRREMLPQKKSFFGRHKIHAVIFFFRRGFVREIQLEMF